MGAEPQHELGRATWPRSRRCRRWRAASVAFFAEYDVLLTPALAERPLPIGECNGLGDEPMRDFARSGDFTPFTALFNVTGQPAISVPAGFGEDGLPTNAHLVAKPLGEDTLLQLAAQLETARPCGRPSRRRRQRLRGGVGAARRLAGWAWS